MNIQPADAVPLDTTNIPASVSPVGHLEPGPTTQNVPLNTVGAPKTKPPRIPALDFTKGTLVLIMVLYHWMNYFVAVDGTAYKYLRFLTPSFTFITGFLISSVYLSRADESRQRTPKRLLLRGLKLFCIVLLLNLAVYTLHTGQRNGRL